MEIKTTTIGVLLLLLTVCSCHDPTAESSEYITGEHRTAILASIEMYRYATRLNQIESKSGRELHVQRVKKEEFERLLVEAGETKYGNSFQDEYLKIKHSEIAKRLYEVDLDKNRKRGKTKTEEVDVSIPQQTLINFYDVVQPSCEVRSKLSVLLDEIKQISDAFLLNAYESDNDDQLQNTFLNSLNSHINQFENSVINDVYLSEFDKQQLVTFSTSLSLFAPSGFEDAYNFAVAYEVANDMGRVNGWFSRFVRALVVGIITAVGTAVGIVASVAIGMICNGCFVPAVVTLPAVGFILSYDLGCSLFDGTCP